MAKPKLEVLVLKGELIKLIVAIEEVDLIIPQKVNYPKGTKLVEYGELSHRELQIITMIFQLKEALLAFRKKVETAKEWSPNYSDMQNGYIFPQGQIMTLLATLHASIRLRNNVYEIEPIFSFNGKNIIKPTGYEETGLNLIVGVDIDRAIKLLCGKQFGIMDLRVS